FENNIIRTRQLQYLQAFALFIQIGLWSGDRRMMEISEAVVGSIIHMLRCGGRYRSSAYDDISISPGDDSEVLEVQWSDWVERESFKRLVYHIQVHCSKASLTTGSRPPVSYAELSLPLPSHRQLWMAKSSLEWKNILLSLTSNGPSRDISTRDSIMNPLVLLYLPEIYDFDLAQFILLHCISSMIRDYQQIQGLCGSGEYDTTRIHIISSESQQHHLQSLLQSMRIINQSRKTPEASQRSLLIELLFMHLFTPFDQIEIAAGRDGQDEAKSVYRSAKIWSQRQQARLAVSSAGQAVRYLRQIPPAQFTEFHSIIAYQVSLCLWMYGTIGAIDGSIPADATAQFTLDTHELTKIQQWVNLKEGYPMISGFPSTKEAKNENMVALSSTSEVMICLRELLQCKGLEDKTLTSAVYDLMTALSISKPNFVVCQD
ncbi:uncharacterized protein N7503_004440, partial [Penicillium pulvis]|uniref:uncharacterized protein n=1 Tax=Penicillium pulvis TaxID=1562058 RepID=UPI002546A5D0